MNFKNTRRLQRRISFLLMLLFCTATMAQTKKSFTLDDLLWGGVNYWKLQPRNLYTEFWGNNLFQLKTDSVIRIADAKGRGIKPTCVFTATDLKKELPSAESRGINLLRATFPYAEEPYAFIQTSKVNLLYDWKTKKIVWRMDREDSISHAEFNPASRSEAYVKKDNLYLKTSDGKIHQISADGSRELVYGQSVHRDEFGIHKGTFFSPKGDLLAFYRMDQSMVKDYPQVNIFAREAVVAPDKYPMAGMTSHEVTVGIFNPATDKTTWLQAGNPKNRYFTNITWSPDEKTIYMIELPRSQKKAELVAYDVATGKRKGTLYTEINNKYVHPMHGIYFLPWDSSKFLYMSEKDGYNQIYLFNTKGQCLKQLTRGNFVVLDIAGFKPGSKEVLIKSTEAGDLRHNFYSVNVKTGKRRLLDNGSGVHRAAFSADGSLMTDRWSEPDTYRKIALRKTDTNKSLPLQDAPSPWKDYETPQIVSGSITAADGKTPLYYRMVKPVHFDPKKKYPAVVYVYGGPGIRNVTDTWNYGARGWEIYMAQRGYLIFVLDNRGSSERGFNFETATYHHLGIEEMKDQMKGVEFLKSLPYVDADRLGVHGWSFGGFMTINLMCTYPGVFKVAVAGGPVIDWKYYEVMYGERYMGTPQENPEGYKASSLLPKAKNLKGRLQIIIGYNDPTCVPQHSLMFLRKCEDAGTQPDFFVYPGQGHNMMGKDMIHLHRRITRYFDDYLK